MRPPCTLGRESWPPDYVAVLAWRQAQLARFELNPELVESALAYYAARPIEFINHWVDTFDPRNAGRGLPVRMPLILFEKQQELIEFVLACLKDEQNGLAEKCRDMGATWTCGALSVWIWRFMPGASVGWGSRKQELVDRLGDLDSIFEKLRTLIRCLPPVFLPKGFREDDHLLFQRILNPENGATITGEVGKNIGRGGRKLIYFKDESAHYEQAESIEAALMDNTRCQIDISSVHGLNNVFHRKREAGTEWRPGVEIPRGVTRVFIMDWRDHPAKSQTWYDERKASADASGLGHKFSQEVDRDYAASVVGTIIPGAWVKSAIDAHKLLKLDETGPWGGALDVADEEGLDGNALVKRQGVIIRSADEWKGIDTGKTARKAADNLKGMKNFALQYDCIGVGAGVKSEVNRLVEEDEMPKGIKFVPWNAATSPLNPEKRFNPHDKESPLNKELFYNLKAQAWWELRGRFERTHKAVELAKQGKAHVFDPETLISIDSAIPQLRQIEKELSQPTIGPGAKMKMVVNKTPDGTKSPNIGDAIMMAFFPVGSTYTLANI